MTNKLKYLNWSNLVIAISLLSLVLAPTTSAIAGKYDAEFYSGNSITLYNPEDTAAGCPGGGSSTPSGASGSISLTKSPALELIFQTLINGGLTNLQAAAVMGNMQQESGFNSNAREPNGIGYGLVQW